MQTEFTIERASSDAANAPANALRGGVAVEMVGEKLIDGPPPSSALL